MSYNEPSPITFPLAGGLTMGFHMNANRSSGMFRQTIATKMVVRMGSDRMRPLSELVELLRRIKNFLCLAFDRAISVTSFTGYCSDPNTLRDLGEIVPIYNRLDSYDLMEQHFGLDQFLLQFKDIDDSIQDHIEKWLEGYEEYEPTLNLYFAVTANRYMHLEGRFLFLVQGIESLHRRSSSATEMPPSEFDNLWASLLESTPEEWKSWLNARMRYANEPSLRNRMREIVEPFSDLFDAPSAQQRFINDVVNTRNYLTHYDADIRSQAVTAPDELWRLYHKLEGLVQLQLLHLLGFEAGRIKAIVMQYPRLRRKLGMV